MSTPAQNEQQIAANTKAIADLNQAVNFLVSDFIRPNAQQHLQSLARLEKLEEVVEAIAQPPQTTAQQQQTIAQQQAATAQQIERNAEALNQYDNRLEETRQLVAKNASDIAQATARIDARLDRTDAQISLLIEENKAFRESQQSQLAALINNSRRIDQLEQQAS